MLLWSQKRREFDDRNSSGMAEDNFKIPMKNRSGNFTKKTQNKSTEWVASAPQNTARILDQQNQTPKSKNEITKCRCKSQIPKSKNNFQIPDRKKPDVKNRKSNCPNA